ncbi:MAG: hypothetical protein LBP74_07190, partial [Treponema sp.]|nr:hypothetical protein [Treponema sp.]
RKREASAADPWIPLTSSPVTAVSFDNKLSGSSPPAEGTAYEYLVGISLDGMVTHPEENARFAAEMRGKKDAVHTDEQNISGFVLPNPMMISASKTDNGDYSEVVKWSAAAVDKLVSEKNNRGVAGYAIEVRDQSHARNWQIIKTVEIPAGEDPADFTENLYNTNGLLNVLRDYRHYFRVRAYAADEIYSPPPDDLPLDGSENDYIKWGARQINATEFAGLTSLAIGQALAGKEYSVGSLFSPDKNNDINLAGNKPFFLTISGTIRVVGHYSLLDGNSIKSYNNTLTFSFANVDGLPFTYGGSVSINGLTSGGGTYSVTFNGATVSVDGKYIRTPFTFSGTTSQNCDGFHEWNETSGWQ